MALAAATGVVALGGASALAVASSHQTVGPKADGTAVTPVGFRVTPVGVQTALGSLPTISAVSPDGKTLVVVNSGDADESVSVVDVASQKVVQTISYRTPEAVFAGVVFSPDGQRLFVSGGGNEKIRTYSVTGQQLTEGAPLALPKTNSEGKAVNLYPAGLAITPDGKRLVVADSAADAASVVDIATGAVQTIPVGHAPYGVAIAKDGRKAYITNQGASTMAVLDIGGATPAPAKTVTVGTHPNRVLLSADGTTAYVADGDSDEISVVDTASDTTTKTISLVPYAGAQVGANPDGLDLSSDGKTLYVANSGDNDVAVVDLASGGISGMIPTAWYPTDVKSINGNLMMLSAKGVGAGPNPGGPNPYTDDSRRTADPQGFMAQYVGTMMKGQLSTIPAPSLGQLNHYTETVRANDGFNDGDRVRNAQGPGSSVIPRRVGDGSPIKHVIYVVKENRTYDQEFGSLGQGNGDPALNLFGDESATNSRALQRQYSTLDNFYANAEVSAQGWNWAVAANSNPYTEQTWVGNYSGRNHDYPSESSNPAIAPNKNPSDAYLWDRLADANISFRNYGYYVTPTGAGQVKATDPRLDANTDHSFIGFDMNCPDSAGTFAAKSANCGPVPRIEEWKKEFHAYTASGSLPAMEFVRLPNDHTSGTRPGYPTPKAYIADNDWAVGQLVDEVSHSAFWKDTAIFVTEDDAQAGPDHVDAHRTISQVISPYTHAGKVDSTQYSTASMLRTMELILGVKPMTQFDTYANPMVDSFTNKPDLRPYSATRPSTNLQETNGANAPMAAQSAAQNLNDADRIDQAVFNQAIWKSVKGGDVPMPPPLDHGAPTDTPKNPTPPAADQPSAPSQAPEQSPAQPAPASPPPSRDSDD